MSKELKACQKTLRQTLRSGNTRVTDPLQKNKAHSDRQRHANQS